MDKLVTKSLKCNKGYKENMKIEAKIIQTNMFIMTLL